MGKGGKEVAFLRGSFCGGRTDCCVNRGKGNVVLIFNSSAVTVGATRPTSDEETGVLHFSS